MRVARDVMDVVAVVHDVMVHVVRKRVVARAEHVRR
jgi:hypothetical protein